MNSADEDLIKVLLEQLIKLDASTEYLNQLKRDMKNGDDIKIADIEASLKIIVESKAYKLRRLHELISKN